MPVPELELPEENFDRGRLCGQRPSTEPASDLSNLAPDSYVPMGSDLGRVESPIETTMASSLSASKLMSKRISDSFLPS